MENLSISENSGIQKYIIQFIGICFMLACIYGCAGLLKWVINHKEDNREVIQATEITAQFRERQLACLARNIYFEAGNEPFEGKVAVAQVTLNRTEALGFPNDVCKVVYQKNIFYEKVVCQFSWYCDRESASRLMHPAIYSESMEVAKRVLLEGFRLPTLVNALYYHADYVNPGWKRERITKIGRHIFYK